MSSTTPPTCGPRSSSSSPGRLNLSIFSFEVDELTYSNMVNYTTISLGVTWFLDVVPADTRAAYSAERD